MDNDELKTEKHHTQQDLCKTRPPYRQGKRLTAVKIYTTASESQHLFIYGVPKINLRTELKSMCSKYGVIKTLTAVSDYKTEVFTECFHIQYERIQSARIAKRFLDNKSFYGGILHLCYAPEFECIDETRAKMAQRKLEVLRRINGEVVEIVPTKDVYKEPTRKRKYPAIPITEDRMAAQDPLLVWKNVPKEIDPKQPKNSSKPSVPQKHYQLKEQTVYGPHLNSSDELSVSDGHIDKPTIIPIQVLNSKEYIHNVKNKKQIVFRKKI